MAESEGRRMNNAILALLILAVVLVVAFFILEDRKSGDRGVDINVNVPSTDAGGSAEGGNGGGGAQGGGGQ